MRRVFLCFLEEIEDSKKALRNYLTFIMQAIQCTSSGELQYFGVVKCTKTTSVRVANVVADHDSLLTQ